jgi:hypothetical protein
LDEGRPGPLVLAERLVGMLRDPVELAAWGWEELGRLEQEMRRDAAAGWPRLGLAEVLDNDPSEPSAAGPDELLNWLRQIDQQVAQQLAEEFDIPPQLGELRHQLAPPGLGRRRLLPSTDRGRRPTGDGRLNGVPRGPGRG